MSRVFTPMKPISRVEPNTSSVLVVTFKRRPSSEPEEHSEGVNWKGHQPLPGDWSMTSGTWIVRGLDSPSVQMIARDPRVLSIKYAKV